MAFVYNINVDNVNGALPRGLALLSASGLREDSRNGDVAVMAGPVMTIYNKPWERVLFSSIRDANPFFHLFESLWMLAGRDDIRWIAQFNKRMAAYSDDGARQPAAYGYRWRRYFGYDQIEAVVTELTNNPGSRRAVMTMWDGGQPAEHPLGTPSGDLGRILKGTADAPCNTQCYFRIVNGGLDMMVTCRSNDVLWGAYGANAVHFSVLLEYVAARLGLAVGVMYQLSFNYHVYLDVLGGAKRATEMLRDAEATDYYARGIGTMPLVQGAMHEPERVADFDADLRYFMDIADPAIDDVSLHENSTPSHLITGYRTPFFADVVQPMLWAWGAHKRKNYGEALGHAGKILAQDWQTACIAWLQRRQINHNAKKDG